MSEQQQQPSSSGTRSASPPVPGPVAPAAPAPVAPAPSTVGGPVMNGQVWPQQLAQPNGVMMVQQLAQPYGPMAQQPQPHGPMTQQPQPQPHGPMMQQPQPQPHGPMTQQPQHLMMQSGHHFVQPPTQLFSAPNPAYPGAPIYSAPYQNQSSYAGGPVMCAPQAVAGCSTAPPYFHYPVGAPSPNMKRLGRPPGSKNKPKKSRCDNDEDYEPPATRRRSSENHQKAVELPHVADWEIEIPNDDEAACSKCFCNGAMFLMKPCYHYGFCYQCLQNRVNDNCIACGAQVVEYCKYYRAAHNPNP